MNGHPILNFQVVNVGDFGDADMNLLMFFIMLVAVCLIEDSSYADVGGSHGESVAWSEITKEELNGNQAVEKN